MRLTDCAPGDLVAIEWPHGSDHSVHGLFSDRALRGTEQIVSFRACIGLVGKRKRNAALMEHHSALVVVCDYHTHRAHERDGWRIIDDVEILDVVQAKRSRAGRAVELAHEHEGDQDDPLLRARRAPSLPRGTGSK